MSASTVPSPVATLEGFSQVAERYDLILCDVWGVLHDGKRHHTAAGQALIRFRGRPGRRVILVSNAPRPWQGVQAILNGYGVPREAYDAILTSGDLTHAMLAEHPGARVYHLGPDRDRPIYEGLDLSLVPPAEAERVVCTGLFDDDTETAEDYRDALEDFRARGLPMICANPDLVVERDRRLVPCAGLIAQAYAEIGGEVIYAGKPYRPIYQAALAKAAALADGVAPALERVVMVGDAIRTDIVGAEAAGIRSILVARGIHSEELGLAAEADTLGDIAEWLARQPVRPGAVIERLVW